MLFRAISLHSEMAKLHSASPLEITSPFPRAIISKLHSKACNYLYLSISEEPKSPWFIIYFNITTIAVGSKKYLGILQLVSDWLLILYQFYLSDFDTPY